MGKRRKPIIFNTKRLFYTIQEVADHFAVNISLLRYWEKEFDNIRPRKTAGGARQYTKDDIHQIEMVFHLVREKGLTLEGARQELKSKKDDMQKKMEALAQLQKIKKELLMWDREFDKLHNLQRYNRREIE